MTRVLGFVRERALAFYFGNGAEVDAYRAALRIPNVIRNLLGEGTLSASFIPVYAGLLQQDEPEAARTLSGIIVAWLTLVGVGTALAGVVLAPAVTDFVAPGFDEETRALAVVMVRIMFPMAALFIMSAWCLGILNTHRRFFLSYAAPTLWNVAQIVVLVAAGSWLAGWRGERLAVALAWGAVVGSGLQLVVQIPLTLRVARGVRVRFRSDPHSRRVARAWVPVVLGAGVWQVSTVIQTQLGSLVGPGAVSALGYAQLIALLPVSLFGVSVAAAALPELSRDASADRADRLRPRLARGMRRTLFFAVPSALALAVVGRHAVAPLFQTGAFDAAQTAMVSGILAAFAIGIPAQSVVRVIVSGHYALSDTRTPLRYAIVAVATSTLGAVLLMGPYGAAGIALAISLASYVHLGLNYRALVRRTGSFLTASDQSAIVGASGAALAGTAAAWGADRWIRGAPIWIEAGAVLGAFGVVFGLTLWGIRHPDLRELLPGGKAD